MQLSPRTKLAIVREIEDPNDSSTYYVRAVIKNSITDTVVDTVNLSDQGSGRFLYEYLLPADPGGTGTWLDITTLVYTDSGYTTLSQNYGKKTQQYLIKYPERQFGGGGGGFIDYKKIREMIAEEMDLRKVKIPKPLPPKVMVNLQEVLRAIERNGDRIARAFAALKEVMDQSAGDLNKNSKSIVKEIIQRIDELSKPLDTSEFETLLSQNTLTLSSFVAAIKKYELNVATPLLMTLKKNDAIWDRLKRIDQKMTDIRKEEVLEFINQLQDSVGSKDKKL